MKKLYSCFFIFFAVFCISCNNNNYSEILEEAEKAVKTNPDSASVILSKIGNPDKLDESQRADFAYLTALSHNEANKAMTEDASILDALAYYKEHDVAEKLPYAYELAASYYSWIDDKEMAKHTIEEGLAYFLQKQDSLEIARFYGNLINITEDHETANKYYYQAINYGKNHVPLRSLYYQLGLNYAFLGNTDSVSYYMEKAIDMAKQDNNEAINHYRRNYADILYEQGKYKETIELLKLVEKDSSNFLKINSSIATAYLMVHRMDSAQIYIDQSKEFLKTAPSLRYENSTATLQSIIDYAKGQKISLHHILNYNADYDINVSNNKLILEEKEAIKSRLQQENLQLTIDKQRTQLYITWGLVIIGIIIGLVYIYIRCKRVKLVEAEEKYETLEKLLNEATTANEKDNNFFKKVLLQQLGLIRLVASTPTNQNQELLKQVSLISNNNLPVNDMLVWGDLYKLIDSIYNGFYTKLTTKYKDTLTEKEIQLCCLLCAGFSTKEISVVTQQSTQTIYQRKTTIRQKLKMDEKENIVDFINF